VHTHELVVALREYVRSALQLEPIPADVAASIPIQGPTRPAGSSGKGRTGGEERGRAGGGGRGGDDGMGMGMGGGVAMGGVGIGAAISSDPENSGQS
jgi:hypothetical protein